jgi:DNA-binding transcriptional ArsR family regulator
LETSLEARIMPRPVSIDPRLAKALSNTLRADALALIAEGVDSPKRIAEKLGLDLRNVAYHVRVLKSLDCIELVEARPRRGATEHVYRLTERATKKG